MSIKKKIVWLPYDMDTAIGINNEGELVFGYELEDIDHQTGGANIFNGQDSVIWKNIRAAFPDELKAMYRSLRSSGALSYQIVEQMFEDHQGTWSEAIYNEDSRFKYIDPFVLNNVNYLGMLLGSKAEQRKWWLYNRFRYMDSKYIAGDAMTDTITLRPYAAANISITPYADIYATIAWDAKITQERCPRNTSVTLECPYQSMNDNVVTIYSASQLASIGDVSVLQVGLVDISRATRLQSLKIGDSSSNYDNINLRSLTLGNNVLLQTLDARNCSGLGDTTIQGHTQTTVDISGCSIIENVYFEGTKIQGITLPNGGVLKKLHLPATITNLTVRNQSGITDFSMPSYQNISTLRIENCGSAIPVLDILDDISANSRVRILGFELTVTSTDDVEDFFDYLDTMRGLDENGNNLENAVVSGDILGLDTVTGAWMAAMNARGYTDVNIHYNHVSSVLTLMSYDNTTVLKTIVCNNGTPSESIPAVPTKPDSSDGHYSYTGIGWNTQPDKDTADPDATTNVIADRTIYPAYTATVKTYTVTWVNSGTVIETDTGVAWGTLPHYDGSTPTYDGQTSTGWDRDLTQPITGNTTINATYKPKYTATFVRGTVDGGGTLYTASFVEGTTPVYGGSTPTSTQGSAEDYPFEGWSPALAPIYANTTYTAQFGSPVVDEEITDSWDTIIANIDNGTYKTKYKLGNYKPLDLGTEGTINMQIVAIDGDELASGGYAPLTFVGKSTVNSLGAWTFGAPIDISLIPSNVSARLQKVVKTLKYSDGRELSIKYLKIWQPSARELCISDTMYMEGNGVKYSAIFKTASDLKRTTPDGSSTEYWTRTHTGNSRNNNAISVNTNGEFATTKATYTNRCRYVLGFCLGLEPETITDTWAEIFAAEQDGTYSTKYSIGDTKEIDLGTEGKHLMEIVAFDTDDKADGSGKAKITWISKDVLATTHRMNPSRTANTEGTGSLGGWEKSEMRTYLKETIKPLIPETIRNAIVPVTKIQNAYQASDGTAYQQTTTDDVWIPSHREVFNSTTYDQTGAAYSDKFKGNSTRIKKRNGSATNWWLRSASDVGSFRRVYSVGADNYYSAESIHGVDLGFCT